MAQEGESEKYSLTLKLFELGARALQNVDLIRSADIQMREISRLTKETIHLGALDEDSIVYIHKIDSMYNLRMYSRIGRRNPLYSTAIGKVLLAWRDRDEVKQILEGVEYKRSTERTITSTEALLPVLDQVREQGYGEDNEEQEEGLRCIAVPVFDRFGVVIAGLSISFPTLRFSEERLQEYVAYRSAQNFCPNGLSRLSVLMRVRTCRNIKQTGSLFSMRKIKLKVRYIKRACYKNILLMSENLVIYYP